LFDLDAEGRIVAVNEPEPDPPPRFWLARGGDGWLLMARSDVPPDLVDPVRRLTASLPPWDGRPLTPDDLAELAAATKGEVEGGPAFVFPARAAGHSVEGLVLVDGMSASLLEPHFPFTRAWLAERSPVVGVVRDGAIVSACYSARVGPDACETGVVTVEAWQGHGFARAAVAAWRDAVASGGQTPTYSTSWDNAASLAVARALRLATVAEELSVV
jgi:RimJ/RimL family protein N-acetyltransferase